MKLIIEAPPDTERMVSFDDCARGNGDLNLKKFGLLVTLLTWPVKYDFSFKELVNCFPDDGVASVRSALSKLIELGYVSTERVYGEGHCVTGVQYTVRSRVPFEYPEVIKHEA